MDKEIELTEDDFAAIDFQELQREIDERYENQPPPPGALDGIMKVYELFWHATQLDGVPILFTVQPIPALDHAKVLTPEEQKLIKYLHHVNKLKLEVGRLAERLKARAESDPDFHFESLLQVFEGYDEMAYIDYCHISPGGNEHLAKHLAGLIAPGVDPRAADSPGLAARDERCARRRSELRRTCFVQRRMKALTPAAGSPARTGGYH